MKRQKILAMLLSGVMVFTNCTPIWAAEEAADETEYDYFEEPQYESAELTPEEDQIIDGSANHDDERDDSNTLDELSEDTDIFIVDDQDDVDTDDQEDVDAEALLYASGEDEDTACTVTWDAGNGTFKYPYSEDDKNHQYITVEQGKYLDYVYDEYSLNAPEGYKLKGWKLKDTDELIDFDLQYDPTTDTSYYNYSIIDDVTFVAVYVPSYTVTWDAGEGTFVYPYSEEDNTHQYTKVEQGEHLEYVYSDYDMKAPDGKILKGWKLKDTDELIDFGDMEYDPTNDTSYYNYSIIDDVTFVAVYVPSYTVTWDAGEGTFASPYSEEDNTHQYTKLEQGEHLEYVYSDYDMKAPDGKILKGWKLKDTEELVDFDRQCDPITNKTYYSYEITGNVTFVAVYAASCTVTWDAGEGTFKNPAPDTDDKCQSYKVEQGGNLQTVFYESDITSPKDKKFKGWKDKKSNELVDFGSSHYDSSIGTYVYDYEVNEDVCFEAVYVPTYTVTWDAGIGTFKDPDSEEDEKHQYTKVEQGQFLNRVYNEYSLKTPKGYKFKGWKIQGSEELADFGLMQYDASIGNYYDYRVTEDVCFEAVYVEGYTVTWDAGEGTFRYSNQDSNKYQYDAVEKGGYLRRVYNVNEITSPYGKVLKGWKVQGTNELIDFGLLEYDSSGSHYDYQVTSDVCFEAVYVASCTVAWDAGEGKFKGIDIYTSETSYMRWFDTSGGTGNNSVLNPLQYNPDSKIIFAGIEAPKGKVFAGWRESKSGTVVSSGYSIYNYTLDGYTEFIAVYADAYTVTWNAGEGEFFDKKKTQEMLVKKGGFLKDIKTKYELTAPEGKAFRGWSINGSESGIIDFEDYWVEEDSDDIYSYPVESDITFIAIWGDAAVVTWDYNGGTDAYNKEENASTETLLLGDYADSPEPIRDGYALAGWSTEAGGEKALEYDGSWKVEEDITLYAIWETGYTVTWDYNGGTGDYDETTYTETRAYGQDAYPEDPEREGYVLVGWSRDKNGDVVLEKDGGWEVKENVTLYAVWAEASIITFDANGGNIYKVGSTLAVPMAKGSTLDISECDLDVRNSNKALMLVGWSDSKTGEKIVCNTFTGEVDSDYIVSDDKTLYAVWAPYHQVTFLGNGKKIGGKREDSITYKQWPENILYDVPEYFIPDNMKQYFIGWSTSADGTELFDFSTQSVTEDMIVYAIWKGVDYQWADDYSTVTATTTDELGNEIAETVNTTSKVTKAASCEERGETTYTASFTNAAFETQEKTVDNIDALEHVWSDVTYEWSEDMSSVTASRKCARDERHVESETVAVSYEVITKPSCTEDGECRYTSDVFANSAFEVQTQNDTIEKTGHNWGRVSYIWDKENSSVIATCTCGNDSSHMLKGTAAAETYNEVPPSCKTKGSKTYKTSNYILDEGSVIISDVSSVFKEQEKTVDIEKTDHHWEYGEWIESEAGGRSRTNICTECHETVTEVQDKAIADIGKAVEELSKDNTETQVTDVLKVIDENKDDLSTAAGDKSKHEEIQKLGSDIDETLTGKEIKKDGSSATVKLQKTDSETASLDDGSTVRVSMDGTSAIAADFANEKLKNDSSMSSGTYNCKAVIDLGVDTQKTNKDELALDISVGVVLTDNIGDTISSEEHSDLKMPVAVTIELPPEYWGLELDLFHSSEKINCSWVDNSLRRAVRFVVSDFSPFELRKSDEYLAAQKASDDIIALTPVSSDTEVKNARKEFDALGDNKKIIDDAKYYSNMTFSSQELEEILSEAEAAIVVAQINRLPEEPVPSDRDKIENVQNAFNALSEYGKEKVGGASERLAEIVQTLNELTDISTAEITGIIDQKYTGHELKQSVTVKKSGNSLQTGRDYIVTYANNVNAGTASLTVTGTGEYHGSKTVTFKINAASISGAVVIAADQTYTGSALKPSPTVKIGSTVLVSGVDYTVSYENNINAGTALIRITGKGNYTGNAQGAFVIKPNAQNSGADKASEAPASSETSSQQATASGQQTAPAPIAAADLITIPKTPASVKAKAKKNKITVSWKKFKQTKKTKAIWKQIKKIEVQYSTDPTFQTNVKSKFTGKKKVKVVVSGQKNMTYYIRVRYTGAGGYSNWSGVKKVKIKK